VTLVIETLNLSLFAKCAQVFSSQAIALVISLAVLEKSRTITSRTRRRVSET
jgi:hypothetical protein